MAKDETKKKAAKPSDDIDDIIDGAGEEAETGTAVAEGEEEIDIQDESEAPAAAPDDDDDDSDEPAKPAAKKPKLGKAEKPKKPKAEEPEEEETGELPDEEKGAFSKGKFDFPFSAAHEVAEIPLDKIKEPKKARPYVDEEVDGRARSIKQVGLLHPITIGKDFVIVAGVTRFRAFKKLNRKSIPCRMAVDPKTGEPIKSNEATARVQTLAENIQRKNLTPSQQAQVFADAIKTGVAENSTELAKMVGCSRGYVDKFLGLADNGTKQLMDMLDQDELTMDAASAIVRASKGDDKAQIQLLDQLIAASAGKTVQSADVDKATNVKKTKKGKGTGSGRRATRASISGDITQTETTGVSVTLRKTEEGTLVNVVVEIPHDNKFSHFDLARQVASRLAQIDGKDLRAELETARKRLDGEDDSD